MSRRKGGVFLPLDTNFMDDARIVEVGERPAWLYLAMCLRSKALLLDGELSRAQVARLAVVGTANRLKRLEEAGLVVRTEVGWRIVSWLNHNDPADEVLARRRADSERKSARKGTAVGTDSERRGRGRDRGRTPLPPTHSPPDLTALCSEHARDSKTCPWCKEAEAI